MWLTRIEVIYPSNFEQKTGFTSIRKMIQDGCISAMGAEKATALCFHNELTVIDHLLTQVSEYIELQQSGIPFPVRDYFDVRPALHRIRIEGTVIEAEELFGLKQVLNTVKLILGFFRSETGAHYPILQQLVVNVHFPTDLVAEANRLIDEKGNIPDRASEKLAELRLEIRRKMAGVERRLRQILSEAKSAGWTDSDVEFTIRNGRLVIPVRSADKRKLRGFVHDESASGQTVYIEPAEIFDTNNEIKELEYAEKREIHRILTAFSITARPYLPDLLICTDVLGEIDFIRSKASFARKHKAIKPQLTDHAFLDWKQARHPLLEKTLLEQHKTIVPLDLHLDAEKRILVISGPNAGGKSVCLKTTGLLQYMLQCGIAVPMLPESVCGIFNRIFIDIGDEQSLENDLSTYSSHLLNMKHFMAYSDNKTLIMIDEFGTGTEPQLGGAIAEAVLSELNQKNAFGVIATHYANLKLMADKHQGIQNGAMLFDTKRLQPMFVLQTGNPGSSFAFEIARKTGFPESTLTQAAQITGHSQIDFEVQLQQLEIEKKEIAKKQTELRLADILLNEVIEKYKRLLQQLEERKKTVLHDANREAKQLIEKANRQIELTIKEIKEAQADREKTKMLREKLTEAKEILTQQLNQTDAALEAVETETEVSENLTLKVGDLVRIEEMDITGEVLQISEHEAVISFNSIKLRTSPEKLTKISKHELKKTAGSEVRRRSVQGSIGSDINEKVAQFKLTIDLRGKRVEEAIDLTSKYLDEALLLSIKEVNLLHGKGNGILRKVIREYLGQHPQVAAFEDARLESGGHGITQVKLK